MQAGEDEEEADERQWLMGGGGCWEEKDGRIQELGVGAIPVRRANTTYVGL